MDNCVDGLIFPLPISEKFDRNYIDDKRRPSCWIIRSLISNDFLVTSAKFRPGFPRQKWPCAVIGVHVAWGYISLRCRRKRHF